MKICFDDPEYDGQFLRSVGYAPTGAQIGENEPDIEREANAQRSTSNSDMMKSIVAASLCEAP